MIEKKATSFIMWPMTIVSTPTDWKYRRYWSTRRYARTTMNAYRERSELDDARRLANEFVASHHIGLPCDDAKCGDEGGKSREDYILHVPHVSDVYKQALP